MVRSFTIIILSLLLFGVIRSPFENRVLIQENNAGLIAKPLPKNIQNDLGNQLAFISLGGLRNLIASFLSVDAFVLFKNQQWDQLEKKYMLIVNLAPNVSFYWKSAASYLARDASSSFLGQKQITRREQRELHKKYILKGRHFLDNGILANPDDWSLYAEKGQFYADHLRLPDYTIAAEMFHKATELGAPLLYQRMEFYALARTNKASEALNLGRQLFKNPQNRTNRLGTLIFALQNKLGTPDHERIPVEQLFLDEEDAQHQIYMQLQNSMDYPIDGFREYLDSHAIKKHSAHSLFKRPSAIMHTNN